MSPVQCGCLAGLITLIAILAADWLDRNGRATILLLRAVQSLTVLLAVLMLLGAMGVFG